MFESQFAYGTIALMSVVLPAATQLDAGPGT